MLVRFLCPVSLALAAALAAPVQGAAEAALTSAKDAAALLDSAKQLYDLNSPALKPWHLKASYQLYDESGKATETGTFEYWWLEPGAYRESWVRGNASYSVWRFGPGVARLAIGEEAPSYLEHRLERAILVPFPTGFKSDPDKMDLAEHPGNAGSHLRCVMTYPRLAVSGKAPIGFFPTYCFDQREPILLARYSYGSPVEEFGQIIKMQGRYLPKEIRFIKKKKTVLTATVDAIDATSESDPAFTPPLRVQISGKTDGPSSAGSGESSSPELSSTEVAQRVQRIFTPGAGGGQPPLKTVTPEYPMDARQARISGVVSIETSIDADGRVYDLRVLSAPTASMAAAAIDAVAQWRYKPLTWHGVPTDFQTFATVVFSLSSQQDHRRSPWQDHPGVPHQ